MFSEFDLSLLENQVSSYQDFQSSYQPNGYVDNSSIKYEQITPPSSPEGSKTSSSGLVQRSRRVRTIFTPEQILSLEEEFSVNKFISRHRKIIISKKLNLTERQVNVWFQNRRMKDKKEKKFDTTVQPQAIHSRVSVDSVVRELAKEETYIMPNHQNLLYPQQMIENIKKDLINVESCVMSGRQDLLYPQLKIEDIEKELSEIECTSTSSNEPFIITEDNNENMFPPNKNVFDYQSCTEGSNNVPIDSWGIQMPVLSLDDAPSDVLCFNFTPYNM